MGPKDLQDFSCKGGSSQGTQVVQGFSHMGTRGTYSLEGFNDSDEENSFFFKEAVNTTKSTYFYGKENVIHEYFLDQWQ